MGKRYREQQRNQKRKESRDRRSLRKSKFGRSFEKMIYQILLSSNKFDEVIYHEPNSKEDQNGKDFSVKINNDIRSFGITISHNSWVNSKLIHPDTPQFYFPVETKPETIVKKVLELF